MTTSSKAPESKDYYEKGSTQETEMTAVTLKKLAQVSIFQVILVNKLASVFS
jgi:hypothetical protein